MKCNRIWCRRFLGIKTSFNFKKVYWEVFIHGYLTDKIPNGHEISMARPLITLMDTGLDCEGNMFFIQRNVDPLVTKILKRLAQSLVERSGTSGCTEKVTHQFFSKIKESPALDHGLCAKCTISGYQVTKTFLGRFKTV